MKILIKDLKNYTILEHRNSVNTIIEEIFAYVDGTLQQEKEVIINLKKKTNQQIRYYQRQWDREEYQVKITLYDEFIHDLRELQDIMTVQTKCDPS